MHQAELGQPASFVIKAGWTLEQQAVQESEPLSASGRVDPEVLMKGGAPVLVAIVSRAGLNVPLTITDNDDGTYTCEYTADQDGPYKVEVLIGETPIPHSPFVVAVNLPRADPLQSAAHGAGLSNAVAGLSTVFNVTTRSSTGMPTWLRSNDQKIKVQFRAEGKTLLDSGAVVTMGSEVGQYVVTYCVKTPGAYDVSILLTEGGLEGGHVQNSPAALLVDAGEAFGPSCTANGEGIRSIKQGVSTDFRVETSDEHRCRCTRGGANVQVLIHGSSNPIVATVCDLTDGSYRVEYMPLEFGEHEIKVLVNGLLVRTASQTCISAIQPFGA